MTVRTFFAHHRRATGVLSSFLTLLLLMPSFAVFAHPSAQSVKRLNSHNLPAQVEKSVDQLKVGDIIRARSNATGKVEWKQVIYASKRVVSSLLTVHLADARTGKPVETLSCPLDQIVKLSSGKAVPAGRLSVGNSIVTRAGPVCKVKAMFLSRRPGGFILCDVRVGPLSAAKAKIFALSQSGKTQHDVNFADYKVTPRKIAYASPASAGTGTVNPFLFQGQQYDAASNDYYLRARYYDPTIGRFLSQDPYEGAIADPQSLHRYLYASNDPVNRFDPSGREDLGSLSISEAGSATLDSINTGAIQGVKAFAKDAIGEAVDAEAPQAIAERGAADATADLSDIVDIGSEGESAAEEQIAGFVKNTEHIADLTGKRAYRIPDQLDRVNKIIGEVKNVKQLDFRSQIKNDLMFAEKYGYIFRLYVRPGIRLAPKIQEAVDEGKIVLQYLNLP